MKSFVITVVFRKTHALRDLFIKVFNVGLFGALALGWLGVAAPLIFARGIFAVK